MQITAAKMLDKQIIQLTALSCFLVVVRTWLIKAKIIGQPLRIIEKNKSK
jgi:hypothetical protein